MSKVLAVADDGTRIVVGADPEGRWLYVWGENDYENRFLLEWFSITRRRDPDLPPGEYPADIVDYERAS